MPSMIEQIRANKVPSNMMQFAARGALSVSPSENLEILVYLARNNKIFGELARMTLAGWDLQICCDAASNPHSPREVLDYLGAPDNLRPQILPALLENTAVPLDVVAKIAVSATHEQIEAMLQSPRVRGSEGVLGALAPNPYLKPAQTAEIRHLLQGLRGEAPTGPTAPAVVVEEAAIAPSAEEEQVVEAYLSANSAEIAAAGSQPFQPIGGVYDASASEPAAAHAAASSGAAAAPAHAVHPKPHEEPKRLNTVQKVNALDVKGRIQLALKGNKEERSLLIRDGTKIVALSVLEAPKLSDGEVEKFASQKNVLEAVLRAIPLKRRFMKNYIVVRNLAANPRTPIDLSLGFMKNLLLPDLKNISTNKEVSETIRKLALRMYKQKIEEKKK